jgi:hypothetical protein
LCLFNKFMKSVTGNLVEALSLTAVRFEIFNGVI